MKNKFYNFFSLVSEYAFYGLLFFIPISNSFIEIFAALMLFGFIGRKIINPDFKLLYSWSNIFLFSFFLFSALSLFNSGPHLNISIHALFGKWMKYLGICVIIQDTIYDQKIVKRAMFVFLLGAFLTVISGLSQYFFGVEFLRNKSMTVMDCGMRAITSSFAHYNSFGAYLVVVLLLILGLLLQSDTFKPKIFGLSIFSIMATVAIIFTFSRGSWLALTVSLIFMSIFGGKNSRRFIPVFLTIITMFLLLPSVQDRMALVFNYSADKDRFKYWITALKMIKEHPFLGMGLGTFMANFPKYVPPPLISEAYAHNCYLQIWAETGIFALSSFMLFIISILSLGIRSFLDSKDFLLLGLLSGAAGFLVHSFFETNLYSLQLAYLFWVWVGLIVARLSLALK